MKNFFFFDNIYLGNMAWVIIQGNCAITSCYTNWLIKIQVLWRNNFSLINFISVPNVHFECSFSMGLLDKFAISNFLKYLKILVYFSMTASHSLSASHFPTRYSFFWGIEFPTGIALKVNIIIFSIICQITTKYSQNSLKYFASNILEWWNTFQLSRIVLFKMGKGEEILQVL